MKNRFLKFSLLYSEQKLEHDLSICKKLNWINHFNTKDYDGNWTSISLRSISGEETDIYSHPNSKEYKDTPILNNCSYFREVIDSFKCDKESIRLLSLAPGSNIKEHRDIEAGYEFGFFRIHIPIETDDHVSFIVDGVDLPMKKNECWYANFHLPHSVQNKGTIDRVHLIIDCKRNDWSDELFKQAGYDFDEEKKPRDYDNETKKRMIDELSKMNTETAKQLIEKLTNELNNIDKSRS